MPRGSSLLLVISLLFAQGCASIHANRLTGLPPNITFIRGNTIECERKLGPAEEGREYVGCAEWAVDGSFCAINLHSDAGICTLFHELSHCAGATEPEAQEFERSLGC